MERTKKQLARRRYKLHYHLRKAGYKLTTEEKTIKLHHVEFAEKNTPEPYNRYIAELVSYGYEIQSTI